MASKSPAWSRLVRYEAEDGAIKYGEPVVEDDEHADVGQLAQKGQLKVKVCEGSDPLSARPTEHVERVKRLLGPLEPKDVPTIRCIGLNYKSHSEFFLPLPLPQGSSENVPL